MSKLINFFGAAGAGKSTRAAETFVVLKKNGYNAELSREYAKEKVYERNKIAIACEPLIMANELYNIEKLIEAKVEYIICDCPLLVPSFYNKTRSKTFELFALELFSKFDNYNFFLKVNSDNFKTEGRIHNLEESLAIERKMLGFLEYYDIPFIEVKYGQDINLSFLNRYLLEPQNWCKECGNNFITFGHEKNCRIGYKELEEYCSLNIKEGDIVTNGLTTGIAVDPNKNECEKVQVNIAEIKKRICPTCGRDDRNDEHQDWCKTRMGRRGWRELGEYDT